ncbi:MAG: hypothetical protein AAFR59_06970 [Bacteroidota bacterium]
MDTANYLRPVFTQRIVDRIRAGEVLNLVGEDVQGATRLLEDIRDEQPEGIAVILVDMEVYKESLEALLQALADVMGVGLKIERMAEWLEAVKLHGSQLFLLMNHFDAILDNEAYPTSFFTELNEMLLIPNIGFICATKQPIDIKITDLDAFVNRGQFEPEVLKLPPLGYKRMKEELLRFRPDIVDWNAWAGPIYAHPKRYEFLQFIGEKVYNLSVEDLAHAPQWMAKWRAEFDGVAYIPEETQTSIWQKLKKLFS